MDTHRRHEHLSLDDETGQGMAEYSLLFGFIAIVVAGALPSAQAAISGLYDGLVAVLGG